MLYLIAAVCVYWTLNLLKNVAFKDNLLNYSYLINKYFGNRQVIVYEVVNLVANIGGMIVYQQISNINKIIN